MRTSRAARLAVAALAAALVAGCGDDQAADGASADPEGPADEQDAADGAAAGIELAQLGTEADDWDETVVTLDETTFAAKVADRPERHQQGLMGVPTLPDGTGMLFVFDEPREGGFWMKDTLVPLDIAYLAGGEVVSVLQMEPCEADPCEVYDPGAPYDAALEVNQGALSAAGIDEGSTVTWTDPTPPAP